MSAGAGTERVARALARSLLAAAALAGIGVVLALIATPSAGAHDFSPGVLSLVEVGPGTFAIAWTPPVHGRRAEVRGEPEIAGACRRDGARLECGDEAGALARTTVRLPDLGAEDVRTIVSVRRLDGTSREWVVLGARPEIRLGDPQDDAAARGWAAWARLGAEHILGGLDHLAFLAGVLLLLGRADEGRARLRIVATVSAFTAAHSLTLALAVLGVVRLSARPVEATIAASVVLVASEALRDRATLARRMPWLVAFVFGLAHGLGFAGALRETPLPEPSIGRALVGFNVGVELAQLAIVAVALLLVRGARPWLARAPWLRPAACYALGILGATWLAERVAEIVTAGS